MNHWQHRKASFCCALINVLCIWKRTNFVHKMVNNEMKCQWAVLRGLTLQRAFNEHQTNSRRWNCRTSIFYAVVLKVGMNNFTHWNPLFSANMCSSAGVAVKSRLVHGLTDVHVPRIQPINNHLWLICGYYRLSQWRRVNDVTSGQIQKFSDAIKRIRVDIVTSTHKTISMSFIAMPPSNINDSEWALDQSGTT